ncbi:MAG: flagellar basal body rod protein FlgB [Bacillota bacterium]|nr:flagellar basal body rod protein FlgB [Bacillota bacterium]
MSFFEGLPMNVLIKNLDGNWERQKAILNNIANVETPGYKPKTVSFEDELSEALSDANASKSEKTEQINNISPKITPEDVVYRSDGNGVDMEKENTELVKTQFAYDTSVELLTEMFSRLRTVIKSGK